MTSKKTTPPHTLLPFGQERGRRPARSQREMQINNSAKHTTPTLAKSEPKASAKPKRNDKQSRQLTPSNNTKKNSTSPNHSFSPFGQERSRRPARSQRKMTRKIDSAKNTQPHLITHSPLWPRAQPKASSKPKRDAKETQKDPRVSEGLFIEVPMKLVSEASKARQRNRRRTLVRRELS